LDKPTRQSERVFLFLKNKFINMKKNKHLLFKTEQPLKLGLAYPNIGSGVLRYSYQEIVDLMDQRFGQRAGIVPLNAETIGLIIDKPTKEVKSQLAYLSELYGRDIKIMSEGEVKSLQSTASNHNSMIVPYINVPETEYKFRDFRIPLWGIPGQMAHCLKNKAEFCKLVDELHVDEFIVPDYKITYINEVIPQTKLFLKKIEKMYTEANIREQYPVGVMLRSADEDANYGCSLMFEKDGYIIVIPNGETPNAKVYGNWDEALLTSKTILTKSMDPNKESRVVISRFIDMVDSPGMSLVILNGEIFSLGWNSQLQKHGSKKTVGTGSYRPTDPHMIELQTKYEAGTAKVFETFLRLLANKCKYDFATINGIVNIDLILPSALERKFQESRGQKAGFYYAECNPRWTSYTEAILTILGAERREQTVENMLHVINEGITTIDRYKLPKNLSIETIRDRMYIADQKLQKKGTRLICRVAENPMGVIFAGDVELANKEMEIIIADLLHEKWDQLPTGKYTFTQKI
jgi:hypothetical protein